MTSQPTPIIIGLPASGKTTITQMLGAHFGKAVIDTNALFRYYRSIPVSSNKDGAEVMKRFLSCVASKFPTEYPDVLMAAQEDHEDIEPFEASPAYPQKRSELHDGAVFRDFGEKIFRLFETEMLAYLHEKGMFKDALPDLSGSALLSEENRALFSEENGYRYIHLDPSHETIIGRLKSDFYRHLALSSDAGEWKPVRGAYEKEVKKVHADNHFILTPTKDAHTVCFPHWLEEGLSTVALAARDERHDFWTSNTFNAVSIPVGPQESPKGTLEKVIQVLQNNCGE